MILIDSLLWACALVSGVASPSVRCWRRFQGLLPRPKQSTESEVKALLKHYTKSNLVVRGLLFLRSLRQDKKLNRLDSVSRAAAVASAGGSGSGIADNSREQDRARWAICWQFLFLLLRFNFFCLDLQGSTPLLFCLQGGECGQRPQTSYKPRYLHTVLGYCHQATYFY